MATADYDGDGDIDVLVGGRVSKQYPLPPNSYLLQNNKGVFTDVTSKVCAGLLKPGMITAAQWVDLNNDKHPDLIIAGEYMPIRFFSNDGRNFTETTATTGLQNINGLWRSLLATDVDGDGNTDFIAGNLGLNCIYKVSAEYPMQLYAADIDDNGSIDPVLFYYIKNKDGKRVMRPSISREILATQVPLMKKQFLLNKDYANATPGNIFLSNKKPLILSCNDTRTCWIENKGNGKFEIHALPTEAQFAPVNTIVCADMDGDGIKDILLAGNEYQTEVVKGRYDASYGCVLKGSMQVDRFRALSEQLTGLKIDGDVKDIKIINTSGTEKLLLVAINNDYLQAFKLK